MPRLTYQFFGMDDLRTLHFFKGPVIVWGCYGVLWSCYGYVIELLWISISISKLALQANVGSNGEIKTNARYYMNIPIPICTLHVYFTHEIFFSSAPIQRADSAIYRIDQDFHKKIF